MQQTNIPSIMLPLLNFLKSYPCYFNKIPAKAIEPEVGTSECASSSQIGNGIISIFIAKLRKKAYHKKLFFFQKNYKITKFKYR